jgi:four helix bundle protein
MRPFRELIVWQKAHRLTLDVYAATKAFPQSELYGLTTQIRRASASIAANIAEGSARSGPAEFRQFLNVALGSATELEYHLLLAHDLGYLNPEPYAIIDGELTEVKKMLVSLRRSVITNS